MLRHGFDVAVIRDLTDVMINHNLHNISHEEAQHRAVQYVEKNWCSTVDSKEIIDSILGRK